MTKKHWGYWCISKAHKRTNSYIGKIKANFDYFLSSFGHLNSFDKFKMQFQCIFKTIPGMSKMNQNLKTKTA